MYKVEWLQEALDDLARIWRQTSSVERAAITAAIVRFDQQLKHAPEEQGESRDGNQRVIFALPLGLQVRVDSERETVSVAHLWHIKRRK